MDKSTRNDGEEISSDGTVQYVRVVISILEAALITHLRDFRFGEFKVTKQRGQPVRIEKIGSEVLKERDGYKLQIDSVKIEERYKNQIIELIEDENKPNLLDTTNGAE